MNRKAVMYKGAHVAPGTALHKALTDGDKKLAEKLYKEIEMKFAKERE